MLVKIKLYKTIILPVKIKLYRTIILPIKIKLYKTIILPVEIKLYKTIILTVLLYGCEIRFLILREEFRLRVLENRILRQIFRPKKDANGEWRRLYGVKLHSFTVY